MRIKDANILQARLKKALAKLGRQSGRGDMLRGDLVLAQCAQVIINAINDIPDMEVLDAIEAQRQENENKRLREQVMPMSMQGRERMTPFVEICLNGPTYPVGTTLTRRVAAQACDMREKAIIDAIVRAAREEGIDELYLIDKAFVIAAIKEKMTRDGCENLF